MDVYAITIPEGVKLDAGITVDGAMELLKQYNDEPFHHEHAETVGKLMRYYAEKYDPEIWTGKSGRTRCSIRSKPRSCWPRPV